VAEIEARLAELRTLMDAWAEDREKVWSRLKSAETSVDEAWDAAREAARYCEELMRGVARLANNMELLVALSKDLTVKELKREKFDRMRGEVD
jgi:hypothetical protein